MTPNKNDTTTSHPVIRGGSWGLNEPSWVRAASRNTSVPASRYSYIGFRCALRGRQPLKVTP